jgi:hypothetical protein
VFDPQRWGGRFVARAADDGLHALLIAGPAQHRVWLPHPVAIGTPLICLLPLGEAAPCSAQAALAFWRQAAGGRTSPGRHDHRLERAAMSLRALDARAAGASYRAVAEALFGGQRVTGEAWKTSSLRDATIRLVRSGLAMAAGNYRRLLGHRVDA